jgi:3-oxoacyl-(acyl-carrier-protein) synthase
MTRDKDAVAVTGIGIISPLGWSLQSFERGLSECRSCLETLSIFETDIEPIPVVAQIKRPLAIEKQPGFRLSRTDKLAILASKHALVQANLEPDSLPLGGILVATTVGGLSEVEPQIAVDPAGYFRRGGFTALTSYQHGHVADSVAACLGLEGPRLGISVACAGGAMAIALAARMVLDGSAPFMLAGGSEALCPFTVSGFHALQALDPEPCKPFDRDRNGLSLGEGAAMLVLESLQKAKERKSDIYAVLRGWGMTNDAYHPTAPDEDGSGLSDSMTLAMKMAGVHSDQVGYVNAHGTGTYLNDTAETLAYESAFRDRRHPIPVSSTKSYIGHTLAAAGALEAVVTILSLRSGMLFPTLRLRNPIESAGVDWVMDASRSQALGLAMSASAGFGGSNTSLLFGLDD